MTLRLNSTLVGVVHGLRMAVCLRYLVCVAFPPFESLNCWLLF